MKLLVMGAGYVGMALLKRLQGHTHEIFITTTKEERVGILKQFGEHVLVLNRNEDEDLRQLINACDGMIVLVAPERSQSYEETYLNLAKKITSAIKNRSTPFYILYTSSTSVCEGQNDWVTEKMALDPGSENAKILLETEHYYLNSGASTCVLRLGGIYGPKRELDDRARRLSGKEITGTGEEPTNHIHLEDIVEGIVFCLEHSLTGVFQLVNDEHTSRKKLYSGLCELLEIPSPIWNQDFQKENNRGYKVSNQKIKDAGFIFTHPALRLGTEVG
ncbi:MAG: NAD-dependent epimerase/dehydratase family protein [Parachlamydiaceae bacterium]|nr:NAD-dependent epimerase/dehydratase family protein [Parachlamydiaceae bacterium]